MVREGRTETVGLKASGSQREKQQRQKRLKDSSDIHLVLQCPWCGQFQGGVGEVDLSKYTHSYTHLTFTHTICARQEIKVSTC